MPAKIERFRRRLLLHGVNSQIGALTQAPVASIVARLPIALLLRCRARQQLVDLAGGPVRNEPDPFAHRDVGACQVRRQRRWRTPSDRRARRHANRPDRARPQIPPFETARPIAAYERPTSPAAIARRPSARPAPSRTRHSPGCCANAAPSISRDLSTPRLSKISPAKSASLASFEIKFALPPENTTRAFGYRRASAAAAMMRSGAPRTTGVPCAAEMIRIDRRHRAR